MKTKSSNQPPIRKLLRPQKGHVAIRVLSRITHHACLGPLRADTHRQAPLLTLLISLALMSPSQAADQFVRLPNLPTSATYSFGCAWGDYDNDGYIDLIVANGAANGRQAMDLYHNNKDGTFTRMTTNEVGTIGSDKAAWTCVGWGDANNDGFLDLLAVPGWNLSENPRLYLNDGHGFFRSVNAGDLTGLSHYWGTANWVDYDGDGFLDVFMATADSTKGQQHNMLFHARGDGTYALVTEGPIATNSFTVNSAVWADYDNDGDPDLFVVNFGSRPDYLYRNDGGGNFTRITNGLPVNSSGQTWNPAWGDYNNDGFLDLVLTKDGRPILLRNDAGVFTNGPALPTSATTGGPVWLDYDNDGYLDLFFVHGQGGSSRNVLAHNNGDGTFMAVTNALTADLGAWDCPIVGDFDNDGFPDVFITASNGKNALYRNLGNTNHWIKFQLKGAAANAAALGAKVRVQATIGGKSFWQMREITSGAYCQDDLRPNFGLGDATNVDVVRIEWPSGNVQELSDVAPNQILTVKEVVLITPTNPSASLGGEVTLTSQRAGTYQWQHDGVDLVSQTNKTLKLTSIQANDAGRYSVVVNTPDNIVTNYVFLFLDPTFTKVTTGPLVTDLANSWSSSWGDYDNDGYPDIFVTRHGVGVNTIYHNNRDGTFTTLANIPLLPQPDKWESAAWGDFDNDGRLDLYAARDGNSAFFYFNNTDGTFSASQSQSMAQPWSVSAVDFDNDGLLDLYLPNVSPNILLHNDGNRSFRRMTTKEVGDIVGLGTFGAVTWADYDDDGSVDVYAADHNTSKSYLYHNEGGRFVKADNQVSRLAAPALAGAWGDYDNDGRVDLFVACFGGTSVLLRNLGNGEFAPADIGQKIQGSYNSATWADYDNDGFLDMFLTYGNNGKNALYHNNGDGTFTPITTGSLVTDRPIGGALGSYNGLWFDYDNDGFLDLFVVNGNDSGTAQAANFLYHNNGNTNAWLKVKLVGTTSNRDGVGAKVRVQAKFTGQTRWQRRDISAGDVFNGNNLVAHFGLRDATNVDIVDIEWPSGTVQELRDVKPNQFLTVTEPRRPVLAGTLLADGFQLTITGETNHTYRVDVSTELKTWQELTTFTSVAGSTEFKDTAASGQQRRFYRVVSP